MTPQFGAIQSPPDPRDYPVSIALALEAPASLPTKYKLLRMPPVQDQSGPTCVANTGSSIVSFHEGTESGYTPYMDFNYLYGRCKELDGIPDTDGTFPRICLEILLKEGTYTLGHQGPVHFRIDAYYSVPLNIADIKRVIYEKNQPVWLGGLWYSSWVDTLPNGQLKPPSGPMGGHSWYAWGWNDDPRLGLLCRNSWSSEWGMNGNFYLPYAYLGPDNVWEAWWAASRP